MFSQLKETTGNPYVLGDVAFVQIQVCVPEETMVCEYVTVMCYADVKLVVYSV